MKHPVTARAPLVGFALSCAVICGVLAQTPASPGRHEIPRNEVTIPVRPSKPAFAGEQGEQSSSEISFDRRTRTVTVKLSVEDPSGYFIPNLRRENFAVYEDGVKETNVTVEIEHAPVTLAVLLEGGGRYQQLNSFLRTELPLVTRPLPDVLRRDDKVSVFSYTDRVQALIDFDQPLASLDPALAGLPVPAFSEANLYDALIDVLNRMKEVRGRKAILVISTGLDTFSHATFDDVVEAAERSKTPVYCIGLANSARSLVGTTGPLSKIDWKRAEVQLETLAKVSGGRAYLRDSALDIPGIYDDIMEHLRVRYVITYVSSNAADTGLARSVRVLLVNPATGAPLRVVDSTGKVIAARVIVQGSYTP